jgi:hypothetical protein
MSNRNANPNKYATVNALGANTKIRHRDILVRLLNAAFLEGRIHKIDVRSGRVNAATLSQNTDPWLWGTLGPRIGGTRSADGMIYDLPNAPLNLTNQGKVVLKMIFADSTYPLGEIKIGAIAGDARIGPRVYAAYSCRIPNAREISANITARREKLRLQNGSEYINLFQQYWTRNSAFETKSINSMYMIVMENLYKNPSRGVVDGTTLKDMIEARTRSRYTSWKVPLQSIRTRLNKLHELGIVHADLHPGNVVIQKIRKQNGTFDYSARIIDFGRSVQVNRRLVSNANANRVVQASGRILDPMNYPFHYFNRGGVGRYLNSKAWINIERYGRPLSSGTVMSARLELARNQQLEAQAAAAAAATARQAAQRNRVTAAQRNRVTAAQRNRLVATQRNRLAAAQRARIARQSAQAAAQATPMNWEPSGRANEMMNWEPSGPGNQTVPMNWQPTVPTRGRGTGGIRAGQPTVPAGGITRYAGATPVLGVRRGPVSELLFTPWRGIFSNNNRRQFTR